MKIALKRTATMAGLGLVLSGCATTSVSTFEPFQAEDLNPALSSGLLKQKIDTLYVVVDASGSMSDDYEGQGYPGGSAPTKLSVEKEVLNRMNQTIPNIQLTTAIRTFGFGPCVDWGTTKLNESLGSYSTSTFTSGLDNVTCSGGGSPMDAAIDAASEDLAAAPGQIAVLILSDGHDLDSSPIPSARALENQYGDRLCVYSVWVGNDEETGGRNLLQQISNVNGCGFATSAATVASAAGMASFTERVLFDRVVDPDSDGDGVPDSRDKCPDTPKGAQVDVDGCWAFHGVFFDFDKATIKPKFKSMFDNAVEVMNRNPSLTVRIEGHTDSVGSAKYNMGLSIRRAQAVKDHLVKMGIAPSRLTVKGFGESDPARSNDTEAGRAFNRRVYFSRTDR